MNHLPNRFPSVIALALPVGVGCVWMAIGGAPAHYIIINSAALLIGISWIALAPRQISPLWEKGLAGLLLALFALPLITGPAIEGISRWVPLGPFTLNSGLLVVPALVVLAARRAQYRLPILLIAIVVSLLQPDAAASFAITGACLALAITTSPVTPKSHHWQLAAIGLAGGLIGIYGLYQGDLPPQPFVEHIVRDAAQTSLLIAIAIIASLIATIALILRHIPMNKAERRALAASLCGFILTAIFANYPMPLVGYGAAPILGFAFALGLGTNKAPLLPERASGG